MLVFPALERLRQEDLEFKAILSYLVRTGSFWATKEMRRGGKVGKGRGER